MFFNVFVIIDTPSMLLAVTFWSNFNLFIQLLILLFICYSVCSFGIIKSSLVGVILVLKLSRVTIVKFSINVSCPCIRLFCVLEVVFASSAFRCWATGRSFAGWIIDIVDIKRLIKGHIFRVLITVLTRIETVAFL